MRSRQGSAAHSFGRGDSNPGSYCNTQNSFGLLHSWRMRKLSLVVFALVACSQVPESPPAVHGWVMVASSRVGLTPGPVVLGGKWAFVANMGEGSVSQIERSDGRVVATIKVTDPQAMRDQGCAPDSVHAYYSGSWGWRLCDTPYAIAWDGSALWALDNGDLVLRRIDPGRRVVDDLVRLPGSGWSVVIHDGVAYVSGLTDAHALYVVDLKRHAVTTISNLDDGPAALTADDTGVWVTCVRAPKGHLDRIDTASGQVVGRYPIEWWSEAIVADQGAIYVRGTFGGDISRIDPVTGATMWTAPGPGFIGRQGIDQMGPAGNGVWMSGPTTSEVDLRTGEIVDRIPVPSATVAAGDGEVWLVELTGSVAKFVKR